MSDRASTGRPSACSGDMYPTVPATGPASAVNVAVSPPSALVRVARPKSRILAGPVAGHHHVGRLQVAVHDAGGVRAGQPGGDVDGQPQQFVERQAAADHASAERRAVDQLHGDEDAAAGFADVVHGDDVRIAQCRDDAGLLQQPPAVGVAAGVQHLQRHVAAQPRVASAIDLTHAAGAEQGDDLVRAEPGAAGESHACRADYRAARPPARRVRPRAAGG